MPTERASTLVLDMAVYPRHEVDEAHVRDLARAIEAGVQLPAIVADRASMRVVDGFHRVRAALRSVGADATVEVRWRTYKGDAELFADAIRLNAGHGRRLSPYDRARCLTVGESFGLTVEQIAGALSLTVDRLEDLRLRKTSVGENGGLVPIKHTAGHLAGERLSRAQREGMVRSGGMYPLFYVNQVINLLEHDLIDTDNRVLAAALDRLGALLVARSQSEVAS